MRIPIHPMPARREASDILSTFVGCLLGCGLLAMLAVLAGCDHKPRWAVGDCGTWSCLSYECEQAKAACMQTGHLADIAQSLRTMARRADGGAR